jgi:hypothetical protein
MGYNLRELVVTGRLSSHNDERDERDLGAWAGFHRAVYDLVSREEFACLDLSVLSDIDPDEVEESYLDDEGEERCDYCDELVDECECQCSECGDRVTECSCEEGPTYPATADR